MGSGWLARAVEWLIGRLSVSPEVGAPCLHGGARCEAARHCLRVWVPLWRSAGPCCPACAAPQSLQAALPCPDWLCRPALAPAPAGLRPHDPAPPGCARAVGPPGAAVQPGRPRHPAQPAAEGPPEGGRDSKGIQGADCACGGRAAASPREQVTAGLPRAVARTGAPRSTTPRRPWRLLLSHALPACLSVNLGAASQTEQSAAGGLKARRSWVPGRPLPQHPVQRRAMLLSSR